MAPSDDVDIFSLDNFTFNFSWSYCISPPAAIQHSCVLCFPLLLPLLGTNSQRALQSC